MIISEGRLSIEWYKPAHLEQLRDLHRCCFASEKWKRDDFFRFAASHTNNNVVKVLIDEKDVVYGSLLYTLDAQSCRLRRLAVWPDYRRKGLATFMVNSLCGPLSPVRRKLFMARVRENNTDAILFLKNGMGFQFDPQRPRERDAERDVDYYEFTFVKPGVKAVEISDA